MIATVKTKTAKKATRKNAPTKAQQEAAAVRRDKMRKLAKEVSALTPAQRAEMFAAHPVATIEGRFLSHYNTCFLISQSATVSIVGGFQQWRAAGRSVRKGEHGLALWIPTRQKEDPNRPEGMMSSADLDGPKFFLSTVFDISQADAIVVGN